MDAEQLAQQINDIGFGGDVGEQGKSAWQDAWREAAAFGATKDRAFWRTLNRERSKRLGGSVYVTGIEETDQALAAFAPATRKRLIVAATKTIARKIKTDAWLNSPVKTGAMRNALRVVALRQRKRRLSNWAKRQVGSSISVGEKMFAGDQFYAGFIEFGTKDRYTKSGKFTGRVEPERFDFLRPALYANKAYAVLEFGNAIRKAIGDMKNRIAKRWAREAAKRS